MTILPADTTPPTTPPATSTSNSNGINLGNGLNGNDFMTLLVAQLKNQDPTSPMDPTQFVTQLVQFNSLEQLININQDLSTTGTTPTGTGTGTGTGSGNAPATKIPSAN